MAPHARRRGRTRFTAAHLFIHFSSQLSRHSYVRLTSMDIIFETDGAVPRSFGGHDPGARVATPGHSNRFTERF